MKFFAQGAIDNMNDSELFGRTLRVNLAKPMKIKEGSSRPVWASDEWLQKYAGTGRNFVLFFCWGGGGGKGVRICI